MITFVAAYAANRYFLSLNCPSNSLRILLLFSDQHMPDENHVNLVRTCGSLLFTTMQNVQNNPLNGNHNLRICKNVKGKLFIAQTFVFLQ